MISIFVMYSPDRLKQFQILKSCMEDMELYETCQRILVVDEVTNITPNGWEVIEVPRVDGEFCWADMWEAGVSHSRFETILYLDSDRILPTNYLKLISQNIAPNRFLFSTNLFQFTQDEPLDEVKLFRDKITPELLKKQYSNFKNRIWYDPRFKLPCDSPGKGVMSGNTAFTKTTFQEIGKIDPYFRGHGAYADTDLHRYVYEKGAQMIDLGCLELHLYHTKSHRDNVLSPKDIEILSLKNFVYYCIKWNVPLDRAHYIESCLKLEKNHVKNLAKEFRQLLCNS